MESKIKKNTSYIDASKKLIKLNNNRFGIYIKECKCLFFYVLQLINIYDAKEKLYFKIKLKCTAVNLDYTFLFITNNKYDSDCCFCCSVKESGDYIIVSSKGFVEEAGKKTEIQNLCFEDTYLNLVIEFDFESGSLKFFNTDMKLLIYETEIPLTYDISKNNYKINDECFPIRIGISSCDINYTESDDEKTNDDNELKRKFEDQEFYACFSSVINNLYN